MTDGRRRPHTGKRFMVEPEDVSEPYVTKTGKVLTEDEIEKMAEEACRDHYESDGKPWACEFHRIASIRRKIESGYFSLLWPDAEFLLGCLADAEAWWHGAATPDEMTWRRVPESAPLWMRGQGDRG